MGAAQGKKSSRVDVDKWAEVREAAKVSDIEKINDYYKIYGEKIIHLACINGVAAINNKLVVLEWSLANGFWKEKQEYLELAVENNSIEVIGWILDHGCMLTKHVFIHALKYSEVQTVKYLLEINSSYSAISWTSDCPIYSNIANVVIKRNDVEMMMLVRDHFLLDTKDQITLQCNIERHFHSEEETSSSSSDEDYDDGWTF